MSHSFADSLLAGSGWNILILLSKNKFEKSVHQVEIKTNEMGRACGTYGGRIEVCTGCWWGSLRERGHWVDQDVDGRIILRWIFRKLEGVMGTAWGWLRIGTGGGHLWVR
jgi:hypothetical protein